MRFVFALLLKKHHRVARSVARTVSWVRPLVIILALAWIAVLILGDGGLANVWSLVQAAVFNDDAQLKEVAREGIKFITSVLVGTVVVAAGLNTLEAAAYDVLTGKRFRETWWQRGIRSLWKSPPAWLRVDRPTNQSDTELRRIDRSIRGPDSSDA